MRFISLITCGLIAMGPAIAADNSEQARFLEEQLKITEGYSPASEQWRHAPVAKVQQGTSEKLAPATAQYGRSIEQYEVAQ